MLASAPTAQQSPVIKVRYFCRRILLSSQLEIFRRLGGFVRLDGDERVSNQLSLVSISRGQSIRNAHGSFRFGSALQKLMKFHVEWLVGLRLKRNQPYFTGH